MFGKAKAALDGYETPQNYDEAAEKMQGFCAPRTDTCCRKVCTCCFTLSWAAMVIGALFSAYVLSTLIPAILSFREDLRDGFLSTFGINEMETELAVVQDETELAIQACYSATLTDTDLETKCTEYLGTSSGVDIDANTFIAGGADYVGERNTEISAAFTRALSKISILANDKYFANDGVKTVDVQLKVILEEMGNLTDAFPPGAQVPCVVSSVTFCTMRDGAVGAATGVTSVKKIVTDLFDSAAMKEVQKALDDFSFFLYFLPAAGFLTMVSASQFQ
jgi:hypothetical protein